MAFSIDAAVEVLRVLNKFSKFVLPGIVAFQRDGDLHLPSREAVGIISPGISCSPDSYTYDHNTLGNYVDNNLPVAKNPLNDNGKIVESRRAEFEPLFYRDIESRSTSFEELIKLRETLDEGIFRDGNIRMLDYGSGARVLPQEEYFDLLRARENRARANLTRDHCGIDEDGWFTSSLPAVGFLTPDALISFPFPASLGYDKHFWDEKTSLSSSPIGFSRKFSPHKESPYGFYIYLNARETKLLPAKTDDAGLFERLANLPNCCTPLVREVIDAANQAHNTRFAEQIADQKQWEESH